MAVTKHLPIWRDAHNLVRILYTTTRKAPRELRYTLVQQMITEAVEACADIADANRSTGQQRIDTIDQLQRRTAASGLPADLHHTKVAIEESP